MNLDDIIRAGEETIFEANNHSIYSSDLGVRIELPGVENTHCQTKDLSAFAKRVNFGFPTGMIMGVDPGHGYSVGCKTVWRRGAYGVMELLDTEFLPAVKVAPVAAQTPVHFTVTLPGNIKSVEVKGTIHLDRPPAPALDPIMCCGGVAVRAECPIHGPNPGAKW